MWEQEDDCTGLMATDTLSALDGGAAEPLPLKQVRRNLFGSRHQAACCGEDTGQRGSGHTTKVQQALRRQRTTIDAKGEKPEREKHGP